MIICFKCSLETKKAIDKLLEMGLYRNYNEIINVAILNLETLQGEVLKKGTIVIEDVEEDNGIAYSEHGDERALKLDSVVKMRNNGNTKISEILSPHSRKQKKIPSIFLLDGLSDAPRSLAKMPTDVWVQGQEVPLGRWLFGQYNKLLPAKVNCRGLAYMLQEESKGISLQKASSRITSEAAILGDFLKSMDKKHGVSRDEALSTAFPFTGENSEKSRLRYTNQFIASINKHRQVSGLLIDFKFINHTSGNSPHLLLTDAGWSFAKLRNPILDGETKDSMIKFNKQEIEFLIKHIRKFVPAEDFAYRTILRAILADADTPEKIDIHLQKYIEKDPEHKLSESFLSTQRSGAISRMSDLRLVERVRDGVHVSYKVTINGNKYLNDGSVGR